MAAVVITSHGAITPLGDTPESCFEQLLAARAPLPPKNFETGTLGSAPVFEVRDFDPKVYFGDKNFRPLNRPALFAFTAVQQALNRGGWDEDTIASAELGLVLGTMFGSVNTIAAFDYNAQKVGPKYAKPLDFANTVINAVAGQTAIWFHLTGINSTIAAGATSGLHAIGYAAGLIESGRTQALLAGGVDELCLETWLGFSRLGRLGSGPQSGRPFAAGSDGFLLGEGAGMLLLESAEHAVGRGVKPLAQISGFASAFDASRGGDPQTRIEAIARAIQSALDQAGLVPADIDACYASANGCADLDQIEANALALSLGPATPITALKLNLGEALGASGGLAACMAIESLQRGVLLSGPSATAGAPMLAAQPGKSRHLLLNGLGFDGSCCALIISAPDPGGAVHPP